MAYKVILILAACVAVSFIPSSAGLSVVSAKQSSVGQNATQQLVAELVNVLSTVQLVLRGSILGPVLNPTLLVVIPQLDALLENPALQQILVQVINLLQAQYPSPASPPNLIQVLTVLIAQLGPVGVLLAPVAGGLVGGLVTLVTVLTPGLATLVTGLTAVLGAPIAIPSLG